VSNRRAGRFRRFLLIAFAVAATLALCGGALYQSLSVRREALRFPPPGRLVDVGGRRLHLICLGQGEPTVVFEASGFGSALSSESARVEVSARTRVCSYDRMGMGWSDPVPGGLISSGQLADDLRLLLDRAGIRPPYILVPSSIGGLTVEMFARRHPERVAGLVFVDAVHSEMLEGFVTAIRPNDVREVCFGGVAARLGVLRLRDPFGLRRVPSEQAARGSALLYRAEPMDTLCAMARGLTSSVQELRDVPPLPPDVPLVVLIHDKSTGFIPSDAGALSRDARFTSLMDKWLPLQQHLSSHSTRGSWRVVAGSDHLIGNSQPHAVADAILEMLAQVRQPSGR
jgi:pimeloyl-ACP methyl ester carboxylesterase